MKIYRIQKNFKNMKKYHCEHGKVKYLCKDCGGSQICEHGKCKYQCKECGGSGICDHRKRKSRCKECGGFEICEHGKRKDSCKKCGGSGICEHGKQKSHCKECGGSAFCEHGRQKSCCKECGGSGICEHVRQKSRCKECFGSEICEHGKNKSQCKECGGSAFCEHGKRKSCCKKCGGSQICYHGKHKSRCKECGGTSLCKSHWCETIKNPKYEGFCLNCFIHLFPDKPNTRNYKTKEKDVVDRITHAFPDFTWVADKRVQDGCSARRPDLLLDLGTHIIIVEVDENKHTDYDCCCEHKRLMEISQDLQHRPVIFIRFNPDAYEDINGNYIESCWKLNKQGVICIPTNKESDWEERIVILKRQIQYWINNPTEKTVEIIELFY